MKYKFTELIDMTKLQNLLDQFYQLTGITNAIMDLEGNILIESGWQDVCKQFHRQNPRTAAQCECSDCYFAAHADDEFILHQCGNGLIDAGKVIKVNGEHIAILFMGQLFFQPPELAKFRSIAMQYGFDLNDYLAAAAKVPVIPQTEFEKKLNFMTHLAELISDMGLTQLRQKEAEEELRKTNQQLEDKVNRRTLELAKINEGLRRDILCREQAEHAVRESEARLRLIIENMPIMMDAFDEKGNLLVWNRECERLTGYTAAEVLGDSRIWEMLYPDEAYRKNILHNVDNGFYRGQDTNIVCKDGTTKTIAWFDASCNFQVPGWSVLGFGVNISERKRIEKEMLKMEKLESISLLAGGIAHDFNNILTVIIGNLSLAKLYAGTEDCTKLIQRLTEAEKATTQARGLSHQLLTFAKGGEPVLKTASIDELIIDSTNFVLSGSNVKCEFFVPQKVWPVEIDCSQINQVISNLIINAQQAMPDGGEIKLSIENVWVNHVDKLPLASGYYVKITISDQGTGIAPEHLKKIFDPYFTTKQKGNGLGLAIAYSVIKRHRGHIVVESQPDHGSTFIIYLPASEQILSPEKS